MIAATALRRAIIAAIRADEGTAALITGIFSTAPPGQSYPYVTFASHVVTDASHKSGEGKEHRLQLSVWDDAPDALRLARAMAAVEQALQAMPVALDGYRLTIFRFVRSQIIRDPLGVDQGIIAFRARTFAD